ncbi:flagellin [Methylobacterium sp. J-090]|uniref:flagellin N-terminal helical domain-containing protein n=1 Tax=Methylobacterium sp. J-090 TaxID=2836666 RepID=UPI001FB9BE70|nr:flagellin [Methylobacterium sp. J-090]MCJ2079802.1 flagellin [Methylobacterium sp. J-090]
MTSLLTNNAAMTALTTLKSINSQLDVTSNRVSTGQRVSNASDNAAYWSIATTIRTDNSSLSAVKDSLGLGSSAVDTAYTGINSVLTNLQNMRAKLQTALSPGVDRSKVQTEINAIQSNMKSTAASSNSSGQNWLAVNSAASNTSFQPTQNVVAGFARTAAGAITFSNIGIDVNAVKLYDTNTTTINTAATAGQVVGSTSLTGTTAFTAGTGTVDFTTVNAGATKQIAFSIDLGGGASAVVQLDKDTLRSSAANLSKVTTDELLKAINNQITASGTSALAGKVTAGLDTAGRLTFQTTGTGAAAQVNIKVVNAINTPTSTFALADIGFGAISTAPSVTGTAYTNLDLSSGSKVISIDDGAGAKTVTLNAAAYATLPAGRTGASASNAAVNGDDIAKLINASLLAQGSTASASFASGKLTFTTSGASPSLTFAGTDVASFGFTNAQTASGTAGVTGKGTAAGTTAGQGILDTVDATTGVSVDTVNISALTGTAGDAALSAIITQVDKAIAAVTNAATKLGTNKTQIDGQKTFVETLMKSNDRTIGTLVDADIEEESTKLKALQTQQQLGVQALSIANSASQNVLSLFR